MPLTEGRGEPGLPLPPAGVAAPVPFAPVVAAGSDPDPHAVALVATEAASRAAAATLARFDPRLVRWLVSMVSLGGSAPT
ncbi:MAG: hypothetical protein ACKVZ6_00125 [Kineosporiaceae bacterium]